MRRNVLIVAMGEFGRTPKINTKGGRDHWPKVNNVLLSGGSYRMGQVIGASTRDAGEPASNAVGLDNLIATIMHTLLDIPKLRTESGIPAETLRALTAGQPIPGLL